jgi:hypothetical protein
VFRWLRTGNPYNVLLLLVYAIVIKYYFLLHPAPPLSHPPSDGPLYPFLVSWLRDQAALSNAAFGILTFILLFIEALLLNGTVNRFRVMPGSNYFPAFCFLLFSSFFIEWNTFSAPLVAGFLLLILLNQLFQLYATQQSRSKAFGLGFIAGTASLFYLPVLGLLLLIWITLLISRPFRLAEWILAIAGLICPYYFLGTGLFLTDQLHLLTALPLPKLSYPHLTTAYWLLAGMILLIWWFLFGSIRLQQDYMKMMIHTRKCWQILLVFICLGLALPFLPDTFSFAGWLVAFLPMTVFIAMGFWHIRKSWLALCVHLSALVYIFLLQWVY